MPEQAPAGERGAVIDGDKSPGTSSPSARTDDLGPLTARFYGHRMQREFIAMKRVQSAILILAAGALILVGAALYWLWGMV